MPGLRPDQQEYFDSIRRDYCHSIGGLHEERRSLGIKTILAALAVRKLTEQAVSSDEIFHDTPMELVEPPVRRQLARLAAAHVEPAGIYTPDQLLDSLRDGNLHITN